MKSVLLALACLLSVTVIRAQEPIKLLEANPHYFEYKDKPLALVTSAEHYGALINKGFDYETYLRTLHVAGMNYTRIFMGSYFEIPGDSFGIKFNTLAPYEGNALIPWQRVETESGKKYDWSSYNDEYFERLHQFMALANQLNIIVEVTFFSSIYRDEHWDISPQNPKNRINAEVDSLDRRLAHTLENGGLLSLQKGYVQKIVKELNDYDNFFFEIQNEPWSDRGISILNLMNLYVTDGPDWTKEVEYADQLSLDWQNAMIETIVKTEIELPKKHLIAQNYSNFKSALYDVNPNVSIVNFHYNWPESAEWNYHLNRVIGFDESGFAGNEDWVYRRQAWAFLMSGGGLFNHLDYSFFEGKEDGTGVNEAPGGGSVQFRKEMKILSDFIHSLNLEGAKPNKTLIKSAPGLLTFAMDDGEEGFAIYVVEAGKRASIITMELPKGEYEVYALDPTTGDNSLVSYLNSNSEETSLSIDLEKGESVYHIKKK